MPTVLITGANRGIGLEFARQYQADGWDLTLLARQSSDELEQLGLSIEQVDMTDLDAIEQFGRDYPRPLDLLIANAGIMTPEEADSADDARGWSEMLTVNAIAPYLLAKSLTRQVGEARGKMIAISSGMGSIGESSGGYVPYRTSKAALNMAWHGLAIEVKRLGIVTAVLDPGWVQTRMGGASAPTPPEQSVGDMRRLIERLGPVESGGFFKRDGSRHAW
jgi:NAD(P)-dependent dehydrogenase (short-subunit alcohol dehydrogenase family)